MSTGVGSQKSLTNPANAGAVHFLQPDPFPVTRRPTLADQVRGRPIRVPARLQHTSLPAAVLPMVQIAPKKNPVLANRHEMGRSDCAVHSKARRPSRNHPPAPFFHGLKTHRARYRCLPSTAVAHISRPLRPKTHHWCILLSDLSASAQPNTSIGLWQAECGAHLSQNRDWPEIFIPLALPSAARRAS